MGKNRLTTQKQAEVSGFDEIEERELGLVVGGTGQQEASEVIVGRGAATEGTGTFTRARCWRRKDLDEPWLLSRMRAGGEAVRRLTHGRARETF